MTLAAGTRLGVYEISGPLGAGGMGEVYRATDTSLKREVAIKMLPESLAAAADRLARLQREAEVLASLNHANIAHVYGLEQGAGTTALVMELVDGPTLADRIAQGPIPVEDALGIAEQIAAALEAAHVRGIVHRDLKPANVKLAADGLVKVLDFGIAKALDVRVTTAPGMPALTTPAMTAAGMVLGTAAYMSPEQARGRAVDQRADIWAFGCVLYEMLTGQLAFGGEDVTIVLARVLERSPDLNALPAAVPEAVRRTLALCFEKDPKNRIADIRDVKLALAGRFATAAVHDSAASARRFSLPFGVAALLLGGTIAGVGAWLLKPAPPEAHTRVVRATYPLPGGASFAQLARAVAISPDGGRVVYSAADGMQLLELETGTAAPVRGPQPATANAAFGPVFSPDGLAFAYYAVVGMQRIAIGGGPPVQLGLAGRQNPYLGFSWAFGNEILFGQDDGVHALPADGSFDQQQLIATDGRAAALSPQRLPNGWILYTRIQPTSTAPFSTAGEIVLALPDTGAQHVLSQSGTNARYLPSGHLAVMRQNVLYAAPFDLDRMELTDMFVPVVEGISTTIAGIGQYDVSARGDLVYIPGVARVSGIATRLAVSGNGETPSLRDLGIGSFSYVRAARDGTRFAVDTDDGAEAIVWIVERAGTSAPRRLTFEGRNAYAVWSPDGERVAFQSDRDGDPAIYAQRIDGTGGAQRLTTPREGEAHLPESWSPDGKHIAFTVSKDGEPAALWTLALDDGAVTRFGTIESEEPIGAVFSPDGRWLAYHAAPPGLAGDSTSSGVFVEPFPATGARYQVPKVARDFHPVWAPDGSGLYYIGSVASGQIVFVSASAEAGLVFGDPTVQPFELTAGRLSGSDRAFDVLPDGGFVGPTTVTGSDPGELSTNEIRVVFDWFAELERLVPTR